MKQKTLEKKVKNLEAEKEESRKCMRDKDRRIERLENRWSTICWSIGIVFIILSVVLLIIGLVYLNMMLWNLSMIALLSGWWILVFHRSMEVFD